MPLSSAINEDYEQARAAFRHRDFEGAASLCRRVLEATPGRDSAFGLLAASLNRSGRIGEEIEALKSAAGSGRDLPGHYGWLGELQRIAGDTGQAVVSLERAAGADPDNPAIRVYLGRALYDKGDHAAAEKQFRRALELNPRSAPAHYFLGNVQWLSGNWGEAKSGFTTALDLDADYPPACLNLAELLFLQRKSDDRAADLERALDLARHASSQAAGSLFSGLVSYSLLMTGKILIEFEQFEEAKNILEEASNLPEKHPDFYVALSVSHGALGEVGKAQTAARSLMREFPMGSRICAKAEAQVLVLEPFNSTYFEKPFYGPQAYAPANFIGALPPDRVSLHHIFLRAVKKNDIASFKRNYGVVFNNVANAELNSTNGHGRLVREILDRTGLPVINSPDAVDLTSRAGNYERLHKIDHLIFPKTLAVDPGADDLAEVLDRVQAEFEFPVLLRQSGKHNAAELEKFENIAELKASLAGAENAPHYIIQFHESKHPSGHYLRYRCVFTDGKFYPGRMYLDETWLVSGPAQLGLDKMPMEDNKDFQEEELRWLTSPAGTIGQANLDALHTVDRVLGLDCYGIDFGIAGDGRVIVFEANACMNTLAFTKHVAKFPYLEKAARDIKSALENLLIDRARGRV